MNIRNIEQYFTGVDYARISYRLLYENEGGILAPTLQKRDEIHGIFSRDAKNSTFRRMVGNLGSEMNEDTKKLFRFWHSFSISVYEQAWEKRERYLMALQIEEYCYRQVGIGDYQKLRSRFAHLVHEKKFTLKELTWYSRAMCWEIQHPTRV